MKQDLCEYNFYVCNKNSRYYYLARTMSVQILYVIYMKLIMSYFFGWEIYLWIKS